MLQSRQETAVVVLSYNGKKLHEDFFPELLNESRGQYDVFLIDNASTDDTAEFVRQQFPDVQIVTIPVNHGFAHGYYEGLKQIQAKYYVLLSADFEITPGWFQPLYRLMEQRTDFGAIQPKIKYYRDKKMFEYAGAGGGFIDRWGYLFCRGRIFFTLEEDKKQYDDSIETFWAGGGCMFVRAGLYHELGGLDKDLYAHMEEVDLCWRMQSAGFKIGYCGSSTVYHIGGSVISYGSPAKLFYNYRNSLVLLYKNLPLTKLVVILPVRFILDGVSGFRALLKGEWKEMKAIVKAHWSFFGQLGMWHRKRRASQALVKTKELSGWYTNSIIVDYFLRKKTTFDQLDFPTKAIKI